MQWTQVYDPIGYWWASTLIAALPIIVLLGLLAGFKVKPHWCAIAGAFTAIAVAILVFKMPIRHSKDRLDSSRRRFSVRHLGRNWPV